MTKPRNSILEMFDPLMAPHTPRREVANASPDNSDKENDLPASTEDTISLSQYFERTYKLDHTTVTKSWTPKGKLIDFGDVSVTQEQEYREDQLISIQMEPQDLLNDEDADAEDEGDEDAENTPPVSAPVFTTPQNRKILADIDIDVSHPPIKQGPLNFSFIREKRASVASEGPETMVEEGTPMITLYPPTFDSKAPLESAQTLSENHLSPQSSSYFKDSPTIPEPRRGRLSNKVFEAHRVSIDLQSSFQLQMQSSDFSFDLINDKISFLSKDGDSILKGLEDDDDFDMGLEERKMNELVKSAEALYIKDRKLSRNEEDRSISPVSDSGSAETQRRPSPVPSGNENFEPKKGVSELHIVKKVPGRRESAASIATTATYRTSQESAMKLPMRVPVAQSNIKKTGLRRPSQIAAPTTSTSRMSRPSVIGNTQVAADGPMARRVSMQPLPTAKVPASSKLAGTGPQRVLVRPAASSVATKPTPTPSASASRLPGPPAPSRIGGLVSRTHSKIGSISKLGGAQIGKRV